MAHRTYYSTLNNCNPSSHGFLLLFMSCSEKTTWRSIESLRDVSFPAIRKLTMSSSLINVGASILLYPASRPPWAIDPQNA